MHQITIESYDNSIRSDSFLMSHQTNYETQIISNRNQINPMIIKNER